MSILVIMQGVPGSGKTTKAQNLGYDMGEHMEVHRISADDFFIDKEDFVYKFDPSKLGEAHSQCQKKAEILMESLNKPAIILDNTNIRRAHVLPYVEMAKKNGYKIKVIRVDGGYQNVHGVPAATVARMASEMEDLSDFETK